jgi:cytochrome c oxidase subunit 4
VIATVKTLLIVAYFQHLKWENRSLTYLMGLALALTMLLMAAATYSIS